MKNKIYLSFLLCFLLINTLVYGQDWNINGNSGIVPANFVGTINNASLKFKTANRQRMIIRNASGATTGFVGIGNNFSTPNFLLDVNGGDINVKTNTNAYRLGDSIVLQHKGAINNLYVGVGAGQIATGNLNAFFGYNAGYAGCGSGISTMIGAEAGFLDSIGDENTFVGWKSGYNCVFGYHNVFIGNVSGSNNYTGANNTFVGIGSGNSNVSGSGNVSLGAGAGPNSGALNNVGAIGAGAQVTQNDQMIIGNSTQTVGIGLSGDPSGPQNWLEINTPAPSPIPGVSGLRFRDLTSASTALATNPGLGVLSVDVNGDVIYVGGTSGSAFGNLCSTPGANPFLATREVSMDTFNLMFNENPASTTSPSEIGFGYFYGTCGNAFGGKFEVMDRDKHQFAGHFFNSANLLTTTYGLRGMGNSVTDNSVGVSGIALSATASGTGSAIGVIGESTTGSGSSYNIGVKGEANSGFTYDIGGDFEALVNTATLSSASVGAIGSINSPVPGLGALPFGTHIGVYGYNPTPLTSPPLPSNDWAGYFDGDVNVNGNGFMTGIWTTSDKRYKKQIEPLEDVLTKISKLNGYTYSYRPEEFPHKGFDNRAHIGLIAQELKEVYPELVREDTKGYYAVNYEGLIPVLLEAIKELKALVETNTQAQQGNGNTSGFEKSIELGNSESIVLNQNVPNPFAEQTTITWFIPTTTAGAAQLLFYDNNGIMIKSVEITEKGPGKLNVFANDLSSGIYSYALILDGKIISTKKMDKQK